MHQPHHVGAEHDEGVAAGDQHVPRGAVQVRIGHVDGPVIRPSDDPDLDTLGRGERAGGSAVMRASTASAAGC